jgi:hypothetical protein
MWNRKSILWELEYWPMLDVCHSFDNMHVKKNVCEATCGTLLQQKSKGKALCEKLALVTGIDRL